MKKSETIHERIGQLVDYFGDKKNTAFAKLIGESEANVRGYKESVVPKHPFLEKIVRNLDVSPLWLLTGDGPMLREEPPEPAAPAVIYNRDPRDIETIALQRELLSAYQQGYTPRGVGASGAPTADYPSTTTKHRHE